MRKLATLMLVGFAYLAMLPVAQADQTAVTLTSYSDFTNGSWSLGFAFDPTVNIYVTSLGSFFPGGATDVHGVSLWDTSANLLATTDVTGTGTEGFDYTAIAPLELLAGTEYVVSATTLSDDYADCNGPAGCAAGFTDPDIGFLGHVETPCGGVAPCFPGTGANGFGDFGANFTFTATAPEPSSLLLLGTGLLGLVGVGRRKFLA